LIERPTYCPARAVLSNVELTPEMPEPRPALFEVIPTPPTITPDALTVRTWAMTMRIPELTAAVWAVVAVRARRDVSAVDWFEPMRNV
jgi:hypothetical protein